MSQRQTKLMSYEIYSEIMKDIPNAYTEGSQQELGATEYSTVLEIQMGLPPMIQRDSNSLKYSNRSSLQITIDYQKKENQEKQNIKQELACLRIQTSMLKSNLQKIKNKKSGYQDLHFTISTLQEQLDTVSRELSMKDSTIKELMNKQYKLTGQLSISQFRVKQLQQQVSKYESDFVHLHETILNCNARESRLCKQKQLQNVQKQRIIQQYLLDNRQLLNEVMVLKRQRDILKDQLQNQHKLILRYERRENVDYNLQMNQSRNFAQQQRVEKKQIRTLFNEIRKQLVEIMKQVNSQLTILKEELTHNIAMLAQEYSKKIYNIQQASQEKDKIYNQKVQTLKKQILKLKIDLVEERMVDSHRNQPKTDPKPHFSTHRPSLTFSLFNNSQPTKLLKKHIMNAGKQINVVVHQDKVQKQIPTERAQRRNIQQCHILKSNKKR